MDGTLRVNQLQKQMRVIVRERIDLHQFAPKKKKNEAKPQP
jgi:hypothetical protein